MKKLFAFCATLLFAFSATAADYKEGTDYKVLDTKHSDSPLVTEFFSFYCPHCYQFEPVIEKVKKNLPKGVKFEKNHVSFMETNMGMKPLMNKAYATMVELNVEDKLIPIIFNNIHKKRDFPRTPEAIESLFKQVGVSSKAFNNTFNSFATDSIAREFDNRFKKAGLRGVPSVVVNNKYLVQPPADFSIDDYEKLIAYLVKK